MVFAAGFGTRMRPLSELCAKPAMPVCGWPLLRYALATMKRAGITEVVLNAFHRASDVDAAIAGVKGMDLQRVTEAPEILGTAGGLYNVRDFLLETGEPFVVMNGDTLIEVDLDGVIQRHQRAGGIATMVLRKDVRSEQFGEIGFDSAGRVHDFVGRVEFDESLELDHALFTGVQVFEPHVFEFIEEGFGGLGNETYPRMLRAGEQVHSVLQRGYWSDVGTPERYLEACFDLVNGAAPTLPLNPMTGPAELRGDVIVGEGAVVERGAQLRHCVVWPGVRVGADVTAADAVLAMNDDELLIVDG